MSKKVIFIVVQILAFYLTYLIGYQVSKGDSEVIQKQRVFLLYGEGDLGENVNYFLMTGDTTSENYY